MKKIVKVAKFGGTSMANASTIKIVADIIQRDPTIHFVVVSAPGKRHEQDLKVTDLLYELAEEIFKNNTTDKFDLVYERFISIAKELKIVKAIEKVLQETLANIKAIKTLPFIVSRGEYLSAVVLSTYLKHTFIDAKDLIRFKANELDYGRTNQNIKHTIGQKRHVIIPGFYGASEDGQIKVLDRGGSDITGALIARAMEVEVYENWTDVDGFLTADPKIITKPKLIESMTYKEMRVLSFMGASVLHHETFYPVAKARIPIHIRNTFNLQSPGTWIHSHIPHEQHQSFLTGISGLKNFTLIVIEKEMMSDIVGLDRKILAIPEKLDINVEHFPSGTDTFSMMIESKYLADGKKDILLQQIKKIIKPHLLEVTENISLISLIGRNLLAQNSHILKLFTALINDNIAVKMIDYGSSGVNIVIGVNDEDYAFAIRAMYKAFIDQGVQA